MVYTDIESESVLMIFAPHQDCAANPSHLNLKNAIASSFKINFRLTFEKDGDEENFRTSIKLKVEVSVFD